MDWWTDQQQQTSDQKSSLDLIAEVSKTKNKQTKLKYNYSISGHNENDDGQITFNLLMAS